MPFFKKLCSYFLPLHISEINSSITPGLETRLENGRLVLNAPKANYSFGSLHKVMKRAIEQIDLTTVNSCLLLGMGAGSAVKIIHGTNDDIKIDAIELDKAVIETAIEDFGINQRHNLKIIEADAFTFMQTVSKRYDLIIIDLFIDDETPAQVYQQEFLINCKNSLLPHGTIIFNAAIPGKPSQPKNESLLKDIFRVVNKRLLLSNQVYFLQN